MTMHKKFHPRWLRASSLLAAVAAAALIASCSSASTDTSNDPDPTDQVPSSDTPTNSDDAQESEDAGTSDDVDAPADDTALPEVEASLQVATASDGVNFLPFYVGVTQGFYEKAGLDVEVFSVNGGSEGMAALESDTVQFYSGLPESAITAAAAGATAKVVMGLSDYNDYDLMSSADITSLEDLKGKNVGILIEGNGTQTQLQWLLDQEGIGADSVTYVTTGGTTNRLAALQQDQIAATLLTSPTKNIAAHEGYYVLARLADFDTQYQNQVVMATTGYMAANPEVTQVFLHTTLEAANWIYDHPEEAAKIALEWVPGDADVLTEVVENFVSDNQFTTDGHVSIDGLQWATDLIETYTDQKVPADISTMVDTSYIE